MPRFAPVTNTDFPAIAISSSLMDALCTGPAPMVRRGPTDRGRWVRVLSLVDTVLVPVADLHVIRVWGTFSGLQQLFEAEQIRSPLRTAVMHELHRFLP